MHVQPVYGAGALRRNHDAVSSTHPRDSVGISSASPLDVDGMAEVRSTRGRKPMSVEIVSHASEIRDTASLWDAMVVFCDLTSVPLATAGLAHGAKEARILSDVQAVADYAQKHFRFPTQRVVGGTVPVVDPDTTDREPLSDQEFAEVSAVYAEARTEMETAEQEVQRLERVARLLQKSFAAPYKSLGRLSNPARSTAALQKQLVDAAASLADASATVARVQRLVQTRSKPRGAIPADLRAEWRMPVATNFHALMNNRVLLLTDTGGAVEALDPLVGAKRLIMCCFANLNAVRERVLAWWSSVSTIDAHQHPDINTRIVLVCGTEPTVRAKEPRASSMGLTMRVKVTVPMGAKGGSTMELTGDGGIKHEVTIPEGLLEGYVTTSDPSRGHNVIVGIDTMRPLGTGCVLTVPCCVVAGSLSMRLFHSRMIATPPIARPTGRRTAETRTRTRGSSHRRNYSQECCYSS
eukprot:COSAG02_NODE_451_length_22060_cov_6.853513_14_plen_466_part_00